MRYALALLQCVLLVALPSAAWAEPSDSAAPSADFTARVVELTNTERAKAGLSPLAVSPQLTGAAQGYAEVLASGSCFGHTCGPIPDLVERGERAGYAGWTALGENVAGGQPTPEAVVAEWMASPAHRENILSASYTEIGVGVANGAGRYAIYWAQAFGAR